VHISGSTLPGYTIEGKSYPPQHLKGVDIPARDIPGQTIPPTCIDAPAAFKPSNTSILNEGYEALDPSYSSKLTQKYWEAGGAATETPDPTAAGFGELNAAG
jgi:hypothetical protein